MRDVLGDFLCERTASMFHPAPDSVIGGRWEIVGGTEVDVAERLAHRDSDSEDEGQKGRTKIGMVEDKCEENDKLVGWFTRIEDEVKPERVGIGLERKENDNCEEQREPK